MKILLLVVAGLGGAAAVGTMMWGWDGLLQRVLRYTPREPVDFAALRLKSLPNQYLVTPPGLGPESPHRVSPVWRGSVSALRGAWWRMLAGIERVTFLGSDRDADQLEFETRTLVFRFPDTVTVKFIDAGEGRVTLAIYARAHFGRKDFGANQKRIDDWLARIDLPPA